MVCLDAWRDDQARAAGQELWRMLARTDALASGQKTMRFGRRARLVLDAPGVRCDPAVPADLRRRLMALRVARLVQ